MKENNNKNYNKSSLIKVKTKIENVIEKYTKKIVIKYLTIIIIIKIIIIIIIIILLKKI